MTNLLVNYPGARPVTFGRVRGGRKGQLQQALDLFSRLVQNAPFRSASHLTDHSLRLLTNLPIIAERAGKIKLVEIAIALHDVGVYYSQERCHGPVSAEKIRPHLSDLNLTTAEQDRICSIIRAHDDRSFADNSPEAKALRVLDALDAFGVIGVYRYLEVNWRRGLRAPEIFDVPLRSLSGRRQAFPDNWFRIEDLRVIHKAYQRAYDIFDRMHRSFQRRGSNDGEKMVLEGLFGIEWDVRRIGELLVNDNFRRNEFVKGYFNELFNQFLDARIA